jgi:hypothetical protein
MGGVRDVTPIARILRSVSAATLALGLTGVTGLVGTPAHAAALPRPRSEEWWFTAWDVQNRVWQQTRGQGETVALVDSGVNAQLPELRGVMVPGSDARHGGSGNGFTDIDKRGGHGTGMAGLIAGQGGPSGMVGIAPEAKILPIVSDGFVSTMDVAIRYAADHGAQVINVSQGAPYPGGCPGNVQAAVSYAIDKGSVVVASMGNTGNTTNSTEAPASCAGVLGVGAITNNKLAWTDTQRQSYVSVAAPGVQVGVLTNNGTFDNHTSGTSQASALAAGAVALIRSKFPKLSPREVVQRIVNTTVDAGPPGRDKLTGAGAMVPIRTLTMDVPKNAPNPTFQRLDQWRAQNPDLAKPSNSATPQAADNKSGSGMGLALPVGGGLVVIVALVVVIVAMRRRGGPRPAPQGPYPGGPPPYQAPPMQYGGPQGPGGQPPVQGRQGPPPSFEPPTDRPQGPPQSFGPPPDPGAPPR